ncbi:MAG: hypothetical protein M3235_00225 [Actinomycetota bacterium]|nr:hypothetical protein [Actinomycetota bacterium]
MLSRVLVVLAALLVAAGCGGGDAVQVRGPEPTLPNGVVPSATLDDLRTKLASISQDECAREDPAAIYRGCGRFVREVEAALPAVRDRAPGASRSADAVQRGVSAFTSAGCVAAPNAGPAGDPAACGAALASVQQDLRAMVAAVGR